MACKNKHSYFLLIMASLFFFSACLPQKNALKNDNPNTLFFRLSSTPETLDWNKANSNYATHVLLNVMEGLLHLNEQLQVVPALAESYEWNTQQTQITFKLKVGVKWSDGQTLKAQQFVDSWQRLLNPKTAASYAYWLYDVEGAQDYAEGKITDFSKVGIKALSNLVLQVNLKTPNPSWIYVPTFWVTFPIRKDLIAAHPQDWFSTQKAVTLGPYSYDASTPEKDKIVLKKNDLYYGPFGKFTRAVGVVIKDDTAAFNLFENGGLDILTGLNPNDREQIIVHPQLKLFPYLKTIYLGFSQKQPISQDQQFRVAISMAIDRSKIPALINLGQKPADLFTPPTILPRKVRNFLGYDIERAKKEFTRSQVFDLAATKPIKILVRNRDMEITIAKYIQTELSKNLGLRIELDIFDHTQYLAQRRLRKHALFISSWAADYPDANNFLQIFTQESSVNPTGWQNERWTKRLKKAMALPDSMQRQKEYLALDQELVLEHQAILPLYYDTNPVLVSKKANSIVLSPINYLYFSSVY